MLICDKCGGKILESSRFCPQCGDPVTEADRTVEALTDSSIAQVKIIFGYSSSSNYEQAVNIARKLPSYSEQGEGKQITHSMELPITEVELLINLYDLVGSWKSSRMLINGNLAAKSALTYHGVGCYRERQRAYNPRQYCFGEKDYEMNFWGCKRLEMPLTQWGGTWLSYGTFDSNGVWHFDKEHIRHDLELKVHDNDLCPVLDRRRVFDTLDKLPDTINPKNNPYWEYNTRYDMDETTSETKIVAVGIRPIVREATRYVLGDFSPSWEEPKKALSSAEESILIKVQNLATPKPKSEMKLHLKVIIIIALLVGILYVAAKFFG